MVEYSIYMLGILNMIVLYTWRIGRTCTGNILYPLLQSFQFCMALFSLPNNWLSPTFMWVPFKSFWVIYTMHHKFHIIIMLLMLIWMLMLHLFLELFSKGLSAIKAYLICLDVFNFLFPIPWCIIKVMFSFFLANGSTVKPFWSFKKMGSCILQSFTVLYNKGMYGVTHNCTIWI